MVERILEQIKLRGLTPTGVEKALGLGNGAIRRFATNSPSIDKIEKIARYLGVSIDYLVWGIAPQHIDSDLSDREVNLLSHFRELDMDGKARVEALAADEHQRVRIAGDSASADTA